MKVIWEKAGAKIYKIVADFLQLEFSKNEDKEIINLSTDLIKSPLQEEYSEKLVEQIVIEANNKNSRYLKPIISGTKTIPVKQTIIECVKEFCSNIEDQEVRHKLTNIKIISKLSDLISKNILVTVCDQLLKSISQYAVLPLISKIIGYLSYNPDADNMEDDCKLIDEGAKYHNSLELQQYDNILNFFSEIRLEIDSEQKLIGEHD